MIDLYCVFHKFCGICIQNYHTSGNILTISLQLNSGQYGNEYIGNDLNVERAWLQGLSGCNVTVVVVDDGI